MRRLIQLIHGPVPSSFRLAPFFLNRISRTESTFTRDHHTGRHSGAAPRSRHSGAAPASCHSERSEESPHWPLFVFVRHSERSSESLSLPLLRRCTFRRTEQATPNEQFLSTSPESIFFRLHPFQSLFFTPNPYVLSVLAVTSTQSIFWPATSSATD